MLFSSQLDVEIFNPRNYDQYKSHMDIGVTDYYHKSKAKLI